MSTDDSDIMMRVAARTRPGTAPSCDEIFIACPIPVT